MSEPLEAGHFVNAKRVAATALCVVSSAPIQCFMRNVRLRLHASRSRTNQLSPTLGCPRLVITLILTLPTIAQAQVDTAGTLTHFVKLLREKGKLPKAQQVDPLEPTGFPGPPPREGALPPPAPTGEGEGQLEILSTDSKWHQSGNKVKVTGGVHALYQGYDIYAREMEGDLETEIFEMRGDVKVIGRDSVIQGGRVIVNFQDRTFKADDSDIQLRPSLLGDNVLDDVYVTSRHAHGSRREVFGEDGSLTTCDYAEPHYELESEDIDVRPGKRLILRHVRVRLLGHTLFSLPYLSLPLQERSERYLPEVGESPDEGYFIKFKYPIELKGSNNFLDTNIDYMTKLGAGLGGTYNYDFGRGQGSLRVYGIVGKSKTFEALAHHAQLIGTSQFSFDGNYQRQSYFNAPENTISDIRTSLIIPQTYGSTGFNFFRNSNSSPDFSTEQQVISASDQRRWGTKTSTSLDVSLATNTSSFVGTSVKREQIDVRFNGQHDLEKAVAEVDYLRSIPVGDTTNFFQASDRTPVVTLKSDARRLFGNRFSSEFPFQAELSTGEFANPGISDNLTRHNFDLSFQRPDQNRGRWGLGIDGRFKQSIYSDDTAQYVTNLGVAGRYTLGRETGLNLRYNYLQPHGFAPLQFDRTGRTHFSSMDLSFEPVRNVLLGAQTGYDFLLEEQGEIAWQSVGVRSEWSPASWFNLRALSTYDTFSHSWSNVRLDLGYKPGATLISAGARYDGQRHTWGALNLFIDGLKWGRLKTSAVIAYNGYLKEFEARHFSFTYDLHCAEAVLQIIDNPLGFRPGTQISFFFRLKAFPFNTPFGTGRRGQPIGTGTGRDF